MALRRYGVYSIDQRIAAITSRDSPRSMRMQGLGIVPGGFAPAFTPTSPLTPSATPVYTPVTTTTAAPLRTDGALPYNEHIFLVRAADSAAFTATGGERSVFQTLASGLRALGGPDSRVSTREVLRLLNIAIVNANMEQRYDRALATHWPGMTVARLRVDLAPASAVYNPAEAARQEAQRVAAADAATRAAAAQRAADAAAAVARATADAEAARVAAEAQRVADQANQVAEVHQAEVTATDLANEAAVMATPFWKPALAALFGFGLGAIIIRVAT